MKEEKVIEEIRRHLYPLEIAYDPERDLVPDGPLVTWADNHLVEAVQFLARRVARLEGRIEKLEGAAK